MLRLQQLDNLPVPSAFKKAGLSGLRLAGKDRGWPYEWLRRGAAGLPVFWGGAEVFTETAKQRLISRSLHSRLGNLTSWDAIQPIRKRFEDKAWEKSDLHWMSYLDLNLRLPELLLMRVDKMSMGVSLEGRVPFLDHKFVELAMSIPTSVKTKRGTLKYILKKSVRGLIPDELIDRKKQGFGVPIYEWSFQELGSYARTRLEEFSRETDLFDTAELRRLLLPANSGGNSSQAWCLLNFVIWWEQYIAGRGSWCTADPALVGTSSLPAEARA